MNPLVLLVERDITEAFQIFLTLFGDIKLICMAYFKFNSLPKDGTKQLYLIWLKFVDIPLHWRIDMDESAKT